MQVKYNDFVGELVKLEQISVSTVVPWHTAILGKAAAYLYDLLIYDKKNNCPHSFTNVNAADIVFCGAEVRLA